jgi:hypothetical protein
MKKNEKKLPKTQKQQLRFLVEDFLEKSELELEAKIGGPGDAAKSMGEKLVRILLYNTYWKDEPDSEDMFDSDYVKLITDLHALLKPVWDQFRDMLFNFKDDILPARAKARSKLQNLRESIDRDKSSPIYEYRELLKQQHSAMDIEKDYDITLKDNTFEPRMLTVSFESERVTFYKRNLDVIQNFIDLLSGVDIKHFGRCEYCGKCIVLKRSDKRFCPGCAAKKHQKEKWAIDPEGMKEKERVRYQQRRKKS